MSNSTISTNSLKPAGSRVTYPWRSAALVAFVVITFVFDVVWVWGLFWMWWAASSARSGEFVFVDNVRRSAHPRLFWTMVICWTLVGASYVVNEFFPAYLEY